MSNPKDQHWVPQCYLRPWCDKSAIGERVWVFPRGGGGGTLRPIKDLFRKPHLYTVRTRPVTDPYVIEKGLSKIESQYAQVIRTRVLQGLPLSVEDRAVLRVFVGTMLVRTRAQAEHWRRQWQQLLDMGNEMMAAMERMPPERRAFPAKNQLLGVEDTPGMTMDDVEKLVQEPLPPLLGTSATSAAHILSQMHMHMIRTDSDPGFNTSDCPVAMFDPTAYQRPPMWRSPGLAHKNIEVTLPLSPKHLLLFCWNTEEGTLPVQVPEGVADEYNRIAHANCHKMFVVRRNVLKPSWLDPGRPPEGDGGQRAVIPAG